MHGATALCRTLSSHFLPCLGSVAEKCGLKEAAHHLQKAKMAMIHAYASRPARQTDIRAFAAVTERDDGERGGSGSVSLCTGCNLSGFYVYARFCSVRVR